MEKLDKERYLKRVIIVCWIALAICFGIKLFGGNLFEIMCNNENFIKVCDYADNNLVLYYIVNTLNSLVLLYFFDLAICQKLKFEKLELIIIIFTVLIGNIIKLCSNTFGLIYDIWQMFAMPCFFLRETPKKWLNSLLGNILLVIFQLMSLFIKNIGIKILTGESLIITLIFSIDVFIMILLYFGYSNVKKKGGENSGN